MHFDTDGIYTLQYTATDSCGNETTEEREVEVYSLNTVLYTDGTFIINERSIDRDANIALHGAVTNEYIPFDPNGDTDIKKYIFTSDSQQPWASVRHSIHSVEIGSNISPISTAYWFSNYVNAETIDLSKLDTSAVTDMSYMFRGFGQRVPTSVIDVSPLDTSNATNMRYMFYGLGATSLDVSPLDTSKVTDMFLMFSACTGLTSLDLSTFDTHLVENMGTMFSGCSALTSVDLSSFDTSEVTNMSVMFYQCRALTSLDLSSFDTSVVTNMDSMFQQCVALTTIYASNLFEVSQVTSSNAMFNGATALVGGAGTTWSSSKTNKEYARIDNPPSAPGYFTARP